jgi:hypothetical protein
VLVHVASGHCGTHSSSSSVWQALSRLWSGGDRSLRFLFVAYNAMNLMMAVSADKLIRARPKNRKSMGRRTAHRTPLILRAHSGRLHFDTTASRADDGERPCGVCPPRFLSLSHALCYALQHLVLKRRAACSSVISDLISQTIGYILVQSSWRTLRLEKMEERAL